MSNAHRAGKSLGYEDLEQIIGNLQSELDDYRQFEANAQAIFNEFKQVAERLRSGIYRYDIKSKRFLFFNRHMVQMLGSKESKASDITSKSVLLRVHPDDRERARQASRESKEPGRSEGELEYRFKNSEGTYRWYYDRWVVLRDPSGIPRYFEGIVMDITERKHAEEALKNSHRKLRLLSSFLMQAQEKIWRRIAFELHDDLGQSLIVLKLKLKSLVEDLPPDLQKVIDGHENANAYVDFIIENVRRLSHKLRPSYLEDLGLDESIVMLAEEFSALAEIHITVKADKIDEIFDIQAQTQIYRIFQEALTNIKKHAHARDITIEIARKKAVVEFRIIDDGKGFLAERHGIGNASPAGLGLVSMEERARMLGGTIQFYSLIGIGTRITFKIPIPEREDGNEIVSYSFG